MRVTLSARGVAFDVSLTQFYQGVTDGGKERDLERKSRAEMPGFSVIAMFRLTQLYLALPDDVAAAIWLFSEGES